MPLCNVKQGSTYKEWVVTNAESPLIQNYIDHYKCSVILPKSEHHSAMTGSTELNMVLRVGLRVVKDDKDAWSLNIVHN